MKSSYLHDFSVVPGHEKRTIPLEKDTSYRFVFRGCFWFRNPTCTKSCAFDAAWFWGPRGLQSRHHQPARDWTSRKTWPKDRRSHNLLRLKDGIASHHASWQGDFVGHEYSCVLKGQGEPVTIGIGSSFESAEGAYTEQWTWCQGSIDVGIEVMLSPEEILAIESQKERVKQQAESERKRLGQLEVINAKKELANIEHKRLLLEREARDATSREAIERARAESAIATARAEEEATKRLSAQMLEQKKADRRSRIVAKKEAVRIEAAAKLEREALESRLAAETLARSMRVNAEAQARKVEEERRRIDELRRTVRKGRNFLDPAFRDTFVNQHWRDILSTHRESWDREYERLFENPELVARIREVAPEALELHEVRLEMVLAAERIALVPIELKQIDEPPKRSYYEELIDRINGGEKVSLEPLEEYAQDLFREKTILVAKRRRAIKEGHEAAVPELDAQLANLRRMIVEIRDVVEKSGGVIEVENPHWRSQSMEERFFADYDQQQRIIEQLASHGDAITIQAVEALYAERRSKIFQPDTDNYT